MKQKKSTWDERIKRAQETMAKWPAGKMQDLRLQGSDRSRERLQASKRDKQPA